MVRTLAYGLGPGFRFRLGRFGIGGFGFGFGTFGIGRFAFGLVFGFERFGLARAWA